MDRIATLPGPPPDRTETLGHQVGGWMQRYLRSPSDPSVRLRLTEEQKQFLKAWYQVDGAGRFRWRRGTLRRPKGAGKDPLAAMICLAEMLGPVRFAGRAPDGRVIGRSPARPLVQVGAVSSDQTRTTTSLLHDLAGPELIDKHQLAIGMSGLARGLTDDGRIAEIRPITAASRSNEGPRSTAFVSNEVQHWVSGNRGHQLSAVIRRNLAKSPEGAARELSITNAHMEGEDSVAEQDNADWHAQQSMPPDARDILLDTREPVLPEAFSLADTPALMEALGIAYGQDDGNSWWIDLPRIRAEAQDPRMDEADALRFYLNILTGGKGSWMSPAAFDRCRQERPLPADGAAITVGFDGSRTLDATAIVCTEHDSGWQWLAAVWERDWAEDGWEVPASEVRAAMEHIHERWTVARAYADPAWWESEVSDWCGRWDGFAAWPFSGATAVKTARAVTGYHGAVMQASMSWGGPNGHILRRHASNAMARPLVGSRSDDGRLHTISKKSKRSRLCIDAAAAAVLSWQASLDARASGWRPPAKFKAHWRTR